MSGGGSSGSGGSQTVTQTQAIPDWQKDYAQQNETIAAGLASRPYQNYDGQIVAGFTQPQQQGMQMAQDAAGSYKPFLDAAKQLTTQGSQTWGQATPDQQAAYMNPYVMQSLGPQLQQADIQRAQNAHGIAANATQAGAFGDARHGVQDSLNNFYSDVNRAGIIGQGYNDAYGSAMQAFNQGQGQQLQAGQQMAGLGDTAQQAGLTGATATFNAGTQQQQLQQQMLTQGYNNFQNQVNWPAEQLNMRIAALANSPYSHTTQTSLAPGNATANNIGAFTQLAGAAGSLINGGNNSSVGSGSSNIFSDRRIKENIKRVGQTLRGIPVYTFNYIWDKVERIGVMAQDVELILPHAVHTHAFGIKFVDYSLVE